MTEQRLSEQLQAALERADVLAQRGDEWGATIYYATLHALPALQELEAERERLRDALVEVTFDLEDALPYVGDYFTEKYGYRESLKNAKAVLAGSRQEVER